MQTTGTALDLEDRQAIVDVTIRYCWAIDTRRWADLAEVFTDDAEAEYGVVPTLRGLPRIQAFVSRVLSPLDSSQHMVTNQQIEAADEAVRSRSYFHAQHTRKGLAGGSNYVVAGIYRDEWARQAAGWRIRKRALEVLWTEGNAAVVGGKTESS